MARRSHLFAAFLLMFGAAVSAQNSTGNTTDIRFQCFGPHALIVASEPSPVKAVALLQPAAGSSVSGVVFFTQNETGSHTAVHGIVQGLETGLHGLHVYTYGDLSDGCNSLGPHYNPLNRNHGDRLAIDRHAGDLGNIEAKDNGVSEFYYQDCLIPLRGSNSILGRAIVVHRGRDVYDQQGTCSYDTLPKSLLVFLFSRFWKFGTSSCMRCCCCACSYVEPYHWLINPERINPAANSDTQELPSLTLSTTG